MIIDAKHLYKEETGSFPAVEEEIEISVWRSNGRWVLDMSDVEKFNLSGIQSFIRFERTEPEYIEWLENKVMELLNNKSK